MGRRRKCSPGSDPKAAETSQAATFKWPFDAIWQTLPKTYQDIFDALSLVDFGEYEYAPGVEDPCTNQKPRRDRWLTVKGSPPMDKRAAGPM